MTKRKTPHLSADAQAAQDDRRARQRAFFANKEAVDDCLEELAEGVPLTGWCEARGFASSTIRLWLAANRPAEYESVRITVADGVLDEIAELEREMQRALRGHGIDPATGEVVVGEGIDRDKASYFRELLKTKMWRVEKLNPARYGQRQNIDMRVTDVNKQHLDAVRELTRLARAPHVSITTREANAQLPAIEAELVTAIPHDKTSLLDIASESTQLAEPAQPARQAMPASGAVLGKQGNTAMSAVPAYTAVWAEPAEVASTVLPTMTAEPAGPARPAVSWIKHGPKVLPRAPPTPSPARPSFIIPTALSVQMRTTKPT